jgi:glycogen operon protein
VLIQCTELKPELCGWKSRGERALDWNPQVTNIHDLKISGFVPHTDVTKDGILFSVVVPEGSKASLLLYEKGSERVKCEIPFSDEPSLGRVYAMLVSGVPADRLEYNYRIGGKVVTDPSAQIISGLNRYGELSCRREHQIRGAFLNRAFDWGENEKRLRIPYSESVFYELHVRGFTKSRTCKVKNRGTFLGVTQKIPYLKELGVTAIVLLPCYEFDEVMPDTSRTGWRPEGLRELVAGASLPQSALEALPEGTVVKTEDAQDGGYRINYWGFGPGWLFAPKRSYCATDSPADEFRTMVKLLHEAGIEVIMEMSCPEGTDPAYMQACLLWWREIYHVDGFLMLASQDDVNAVAKSPALSDVKLISDYFDTSRMYPKGRPYQFRNLAEYNVGFRYDARRFLKGDSDCLQSFVSRCRYNPKDAGVVNAIAGHDGFTLFDLVSYNDKHNDANGENNRDGALNEFSWNCGVEGASRKREIMRLRMKQMKNALAMVMLAQGTPMICAGDEMLNSQQGNTNPYCIDSEVSWVQWSGTKDAVSLHDYVKELIMFRRTHPLLHQKVELTGSSLGGFFPDFSCHGSNAWFASFDQQERSVGMMYCSQDPDREAVYQKETKLRKEARKLKKDSEEVKFPSGESYLYVAYNLHWEKRQLALPYLPSGREWHVVIDTSIDRFSKEEEKVCGCGQDEKEKCVDMPGRSIRVLVG